MGRKEIKIKGVIEIQIEGERKKTERKIYTLSVIISSS